MDEVVREGRVVVDRDGLWPPIVRRRDEELCVLRGWSTGEPSSVEVLRLLHENGVIDGKVRQRVKDAQELRSDVQHDYANVAPRALYEAVRLVLDAGPRMIQDAALELRQGR